MKIFSKSFRQGLAAMQLLLQVFAATIAGNLSAQEKPSISGQLIDKISGQPVPYATVKLSGAADSAFIGGTISDPGGLFSIRNVADGIYTLNVTSIGYKPANRNVDVVNGAQTDAGIIEMQDTTLVLDELVIVSERIKARSEKDKTIYFVTKKMLDVSNTGTDLLKMLPGIQVDIRQNISFEGSSRILIFVDGKERDKSYLSQLNPVQIDRIEVLSAPPANYDGDATGAINIIMKKGQNTGFSGHLLAEVPVLFSEVYLFPSYSLNYSRQKINLYTSYNGELTYLDLHEQISRKVSNDYGTNEISIDQYVRQKDWSHRFHFGADYFLSERDQLNFYSFYNPYSRELDGKALYQISGTTGNSSEAIKADTDMNTGLFYSLYYKHNFKKEGSEITADVSNYSLKAENRTEFTSGEPENNSPATVNVVKPEQNALSIRIDYRTRFGERLGLGTGVKAKFRISEDRNSGFEYIDNTYAFYLTAGYKSEQSDLGLGLRMEKSTTEIYNAFASNFPVLLPDFSFRYKLSSQQSIQLSVNRSIRRPDLYQLNPAIARDDPFTISKGNPALNPELTSNIFIEHSVQSDGNYFASRIFLTRSTGVINNLMFISDDNTFVRETQNLGTMDQAGIQFTGSVKLRFLTLNPYVKLFGLRTKPNRLAEKYNISPRETAGFESSLSAIVSLKHDFAFLFTLQYNSAKNQIQGNSFSDLLYFIAAEKTFKQKIKLGIVSAIPFSNSFTYNGSEINGNGFTSSYKGNINLTSIPLWFKIGYQFNTGSSRSKINREKEQIENLPKKGF